MSFGGRHRLAGARNAHSDVLFPTCQPCGFRYSPVIRLDFSDPRLSELDLWDGMFVTLTCHNGCRWAASRTWWDYGNPFAPTVIEANPLGKAICIPPKDWEFEELPLRLVARNSVNPEYIDTESRVGGEPSWLNGDFPSRSPISCIRCSNPMSMLVQWSETKMEFIPRGIGPTEGSIMGNPDICFWFGCRNCHVVCSVWHLD